MSNRHYREERDGLCQRARIAERAGFEEDGGVE